MTEVFLNFARQSRSLMPLLNGTRSAGSPVPFRNKKLDGPHEMLSGDIDIPFAKNLHDPMNADSWVQKHHQSLLSNHLFSLSPLPRALRSSEFKLKSGINRCPPAGYLPFIPF